jgi:hypothetical protein
MERRRSANRQLQQPYGVPTAMVVPSKLIDWNGLWTVTSSGAFSRAVSPCFHSPLGPGPVYHCPQAKHGCEAS